MNRSQLGRSKMLQHLALSALVVASAAVAAQTAPAVPASGTMRMGNMQHGNGGPHDMKTMAWKQNTMNTIFTVSSNSSKIVAVLRGKASTRTCTQWR